MTGQGRRGERPVADRAEQQPREAAAAPGADDDHVRAGGRLDQAASGRAVHGVAGDADRRVQADRPHVRGQLVVHRLLPVDQGGHVARLPGGGARGRGHRPGPQHVQGQVGTRGQPARPADGLLGALGPVVADQDPSVDRHRLADVVHPVLLACRGGTAARPPLFVASPPPCCQRRSRRPGARRAGLRKIVSGTDRGVPPMNAVADTLGETIRFEFDVACRDLLEAEAAGAGRRRAAHPPSPGRVPGRGGRRPRHVERGVLPLPPLTSARLGPLRPFPGQAGRPASTGLPAAAPEAQAARGWQRTTRTNFPPSRGAPVPLNGAEILRGSARARPPKPAVIVRASGRSGPA